MKGVAPKTEAMLDKTAWQRVISHDHRLWTLDKYKTDKFKTDKFKTDKCHMEMQVSEALLLKELFLIIHKISHLAAFVSQHKYRVPIFFYWSDLSSSPVEIESNPLSSRLQLFNHLVILATSITELDIFYNVQTLQLLFKPVNRNYSKKCKYRTGILPCKEWTQSIQYWKLHMCVMNDVIIRL